MIIIAGTIDLADPTRRDEAMKVAAVLQRKTRDEEPGCQAYVFSADPCVPERICVYELWQDEASLAAHFRHANYLNMREALGKIGLKGADNSKYRVDLREPVYDSTFTPRGLLHGPRRSGWRDGRRSSDPQPGRPLLPRDRAAR
jgi:quinol monooxygenase YgiN